MYVDYSGTVRSDVDEVCIDNVCTVVFDYIIIYFHPQSSQNLYTPAFANHSDSNPVPYMTFVATFDDLVSAINHTPSNVDNVYIYLHSDHETLSFYYAQYYDAKDIAESFNEIDIQGNIYLFSCKGGRGDLASTIAVATNSTVIASVYKVSFDNGAARCGWRNYWEDSGIYGPYAWYSFSPNGEKNPYSQYWVYTQ